MKTVVIIAMTSQARPEDVPPCIQPMWQGVQRRLRIHGRAFHATASTGYYVVNLNPDAVHIDMQCHAVEALRALRVPADAEPPCLCYVGVGAILRNGSLFPNALKLAGFLPPTFLSYHQDFVPLEHVRAA